MSPRRAETGVAELVIVTVPCLLDSIGTVAAKRWLLVVTLVGALAVLAMLLVER